jgi:type VI secretion system protein ImpE
MSNPLAAAETAVRAGDPKAALEALTAAVKAAPAKPAFARVSWRSCFACWASGKRAHTQLNVAAEMDATTGPMREMVGHALRCEKIRAAVFRGPQDADGVSATPTPGWRC